MKQTPPPPPFTLSFLDPDSRPAFVALLADRLAQQITDDSARHLSEQGFRTPALCVSALMYLHRNGPASLSDLAQAYGQQHQLVTLRIAALEQQGLVRRQADPDDSRRRLIHLTSDGQAEVARLTEHLVRLSGAVADLNAEIGVDLASGLQNALEKLHRRPLSHRMLEGKNPP